ncbi:MAG: hypothetical protein HY603_01215 [Parcubacteria group bacterium]|nr:hypothetical protein [Parcubacteria group bacterium]
MGIDLFKQKFGYEIQGMWLPRVTAITSIISKFPFVLKETGGFRDRLAWGTQVHEFVGGMLQGSEHEALEYDPQLVPIAAAVRSWQKEHDVEILDSERDVERRVHDQEQMYAGTVDAVARVGEKRGLVEIKTGAHLAPEYLLQTAGYSNALMRESGAQYDARWILRIDQYEECEGCLAKRRRRGHSSFLQGGLEICNHQWGIPKADCEFLELPEYEQDLRAFFAAKEIWEWHNRNHLRKIMNYPKRHAV